jgi:hypothetical protein
MHIHERRRHRDREPAHSKKIDKMKAPRPSLLVLVRFLAMILAAAFFVILAVHVEPAQLWWLVYGSWFLQLTSYAS